MENYDIDIWCKLHERLVLTILRTSFGIFIWNCDKNHDGND